MDRPIFLCSERPNIILLFFSLEENTSIMQIHSKIWVSEGVFRMRASVCPFMRVHIDFLYTVTEVKTSQSVQMVGSVTLFWLIRRCGPVSQICWLNCDRVSATTPTHGGQTGTTPRQTAPHARHISWWMGLRGPHPLDPIIWRQMMRRIDLSEWPRQMEWVCPSSSSIKPKTDDIELVHLFPLSHDTLTSALKTEFATSSHLKLVTCFDSIPSVSNVVQTQKLACSFRGKV